MAFEVGVVDSFPTIATIAANDVAFAVAEDDCLVLGDVIGIHFRLFRDDGRPVQHGRRRRLIMGEKILRKRFRFQIVGICTVAKTAAEGRGRGGRLSWMMNVVVFQKRGRNLSLHDLPGSHFHWDAEARCDGSVIGT